VLNDRAVELVWVDGNDDDDGSSPAFGVAAAASATMPQAAPVLAPLALVVAWTRPAGGRHYPSDVLAGAAIGAVAAAAVMFGQRQLPRILSNRH
jgi:membrane-associated phospholipid phosphatase